MGKISFDRDDDNLVTPQYSEARGPVLRSEKVEVTKAMFAKDKGAKAVETFGYRYPEGTGAYERFLVHRTIFPSDFLADFGFYPLRWEGDVALARLEVGGLQPVMEGPSAVVWRKVKEAFTPAPVPERPV